jgi:NADPH:quinone reductase
LNRADILQRRGHYPPPAGASPIIGMEVAGTVAALGAEVTSWKLGDSVCALLSGGGYAEYCVAPTQQVLPVPAGLSLTEAAGLPEAWFTVWANLINLVHLSPGERLLVHGGSSGIGLAAIQLARFIGAEVLTTVGNESKADACRALGAIPINYHTEDFVERTLALTADEGVDVVLDMVGGSYVERDFKVLRMDGRLVFIAFQQGSRCELDLMPLLRKRLRVTGSTLRSRSSEEKGAIRDALARTIWPAFEAGALKMSLHATFPLADAAAAHRLMESSSHIGKIILQVR